MEGRNIHRGELNDDNDKFLLLSGIRVPKLLIRIIDQFHLSLRLMNIPDTGVLIEGPDPLHNIVFAKAVYILYF